MQKKTKANNSSNLQFIFDFMKTIVGEAVIPFPALAVKSERLHALYSIY